MNNKQELECHNKHVHGHFCEVKSTKNELQNQ